MVGESLGAERRASLDHALAGYYAQPRERTGFRDFHQYLQADEAGDRDPESSSGQALARLLRPFATGSLRHLLSDEGDDLDQIPGHDLAPNARQIQRVERWERIRATLLLPLPKRPYDKSTESVQTPVDDKLAPFMRLATRAAASTWPADAGQLLPENVMRNRVKIIELLIRSISMCNESYVAIIADYKSEFPNTSIEALFECEEFPRSDESSALV